MPRSWPSPQSGSQPERRVFRLPRCGPRKLAIIPQRHQAFRSILRFALLSLRPESAPAWDLTVPSEERPMMSMIGLSALASGVEAISLAAARSSSLGREPPRGWVCQSPRYWTSLPRRVQMRVTSRSCHSWSGSSGATLDYRFSGAAAYARTRFVAKRRQSVRTADQRTAHSELCFRG